MPRAALILAACMPLAAPAEWERLPPVPDGEGVAGAFAGVSGGALVVAGGAHFPDRKPWDGGTKRWHDAVYLLDGLRSLAMHGWAWADLARAAVAIAVVAAVSMTMCFGALRGRLRQA